MPSRKGKLPSSGRGEVSAQGVFGDIEKNTPAKTLIFRALQGCFPPKYSWRVTNNPNTFVLKRNECWDLKACGGGAISQKKDSPVREAFLAGEGASEKCRVAGDQPFFMKKIYSYY